MSDLVSIPGVGEEPDETSPCHDRCGDSMVCYCYRLTTNTLKEAYERYGSLAEVERKTRAGTGCMGCKVILHSLFNEAPTDAMSHEALNPVRGTACVKPGNRSMKGFVIAADGLESAIYSCNAIAPQLGPCDAATRIQWTLFDHTGTPRIRDTKVFETNETFKFDTREYGLPRPFCGIFELEFDRTNYGASRFNVQWFNSQSVTSTHEINSSGRPRVSLPIIFDKRLLAGELDVYLAVYNPHVTTKTFTITVFDVDDGRSTKIPGALNPNASIFVNTIENFFKPTVDRLGEGRYALRLEVDDLNLHGAVTVNFFIHHKGLNTWTVNHL